MKIGDASTLLIVRIMSLMRKPSAIACAQAFRSRLNLSQWARENKQIIAIV
jgi:hypothetical protein